MIRASLLFVASAAMQASSIVYVNVPHEGCHLAFGCAAAIQGLLIAFCYAVRPEAPGPPAPAKEAPAADNDGSLTCKWGGIRQAAIMHAKDVTWARRGRVPRMESSRR